METHGGIALMTTNAGSRIDPAFLRRIDAVAPSVPPGPGQRLLIWQPHLPPDHRVSWEFLQEVARRCSLTGGSIRNTALHATMLALDRGTPGSGGQPGLANQT